MTNKRTLYHKTSSGKIQTWSIWTEDDIIYTEYGQLNGKLQISSKIAKPKNVGRANATTSSEQAILESNSMHKNKMDRKYFETIEETDQKLLLPMLAKDWKKHKKKFPIGEMAYIQPKMDGVRALAVCENGRVRLISRGGQEYNVPHILNMLEMFMEDGQILDGEIYLHGLEFNDISGAMKKLQDSTRTLEYWIYDVADDTLPYHDRWQLLEEFFDKIPSDVTHLRMCPTNRIPIDENTVEEYHDDYAENGFEGVIIRHKDLPYKFGYRSALLGKYKKFEDAEFKIIGYESGVGKFSDMVIWVCEMDMEGPISTFNVVPKGTEEQRRQYLIDAPKYVGEMLTVKFFGRSKDGVPRFPVGKGIRNKEDMS